ncbi:MAG: aminotransferase class III-fold pyridoxal phosphate-dependent enzyme, partial [Nitrososphaeraceae archaeon]
SYVEGVYPTYLSRGKGSHVFDVDNNEYIDYVLALGPIILGYNYPKVDNAIKKQLKNGISFSMPHILEVELSEKIRSMIPGTEMVRFSKTGSDAGTAAVRASRSFTKRDNIAYCGTGGVWHDWFTILTSRKKGIPKILAKMIKKFNYNDIESLKILFENWYGEIAAVYIEPITLEYPKNNFLQKVKQLARRHGAVLIFDEVITGFRFANGGAQELLKIEADLVVFGKGIANGMPLGAITGKAKFMEEFNEVFYSTTYGGETLSLAAASAVIDELKEKPVIKHCWELGKHLNSEFNKLAKELEVNVKMEGFPVRSSIVCKNANNEPSLLLKSLFYQETLRNGILFGPGAVFLSYSHSKKDIEKTLESCEASMKILKNAIKNNNVKKSLRGQIMKQVMTF